VVLSRIRENDFLWFGVLFLCQASSGNHSAFKQLVGNRSSHFINEQRTHLRIAVQKLNCLRFCGCRGRMLLSLRPQLLAGCGLVFLNNLVGRLVQNRMLFLTLYLNNTGQQQTAQEHGDRFFSHCFFSHSKVQSIQFLGPG